MNNINQFSAGKIGNAWSYTPQTGAVETPAQVGTASSVATTTPSDAASLSQETIGAKVTGDITYNTKFPSKKIVLTFDDGPNPKTTPKVLKTLKEQGIKGAVFFVQGQNVEKYPKILKQIVADGHHIGNHTYDHPNLNKLSPKQARQQLVKTEAAIKKALGSKHHVELVRAPYGAANKKTLSTIHNYGGRHVMWNFDLKDGMLYKKGQDKQIVNNALQQCTGKGGVMLMHDVNPNTTKALPKIINKLKAKGYKFVDMYSV